MITATEFLNELEFGSTNNRFKKRIQALKSKDFETINIEDGIKEVGKVLKNNGNSFVVHGEPQSGKTEFMIALTCYLLDQGYKTIFVIVNDNVELETQNFERFLGASQLNPSPTKDSELIGLPRSQLKQDLKRVIFCRKNVNRLKNLIENSQFFSNRVVIDDEADYATPDTNINKENKDSSKINEKVSNLVQLDKGGIYIGVTATPGRLDLNNTLLNNSKDWVFLKSHSAYKGRSFFFPTDENDIKEKYILKTLNDENDNPAYLRNAALRFLLRTILINRGKSERTAYSMLIHTAGRVLDHEKDKEIIDDLLHKLITHDPKTIAQLLKVASEICDSERLIKEIAGDVIRFIGQNQVLIINNKKDRENVLRACQPKVLFTFAIGGNIVSRGLTFENLLTFFFSRNVKGKMTQNTYIQRARMFGSRKYAPFFELCVPKTIFRNWADVFECQELALAAAKAGDLVHFQSKNNRVADAGCIDRENVTVENREAPIGDIFDLEPELEDLLLGFNNKISILEFIENLIAQKHLSQNHFYVHGREFISKKSPNGRKDQKFLLTFDKPGIPNIYCGAKTSQWDDDALIRTRGGLIQSIIKGRNYPGIKHFIFPVKSKDGKRARFLYRSELGLTVIKNLK